MLVHLQPHAATLHDTLQAPPTADQSRAALATNRTISIAIGLTVARYSITLEAATAYLIRVPQTSNVKLCQVAVDIVSAANRNAGSDGIPVARWRLGQARGACGSDNRLYRLAPDL